MGEPEEWRAVPGAAEYMVSDLGRVVSYRGKEPRELRGSIQFGYVRVQLRGDDGVLFRRYVHQLVAAAFHGPRPEGMEVRHLDGCRSNNRLSNLLYGTSQENAQDTLRHGRHVNARKTHCSQGHELSPGNVYVRKEGNRMCRTCTRLRVAAIYERRRGAHRSEAVAS